MIPAFAPVTGVLPPGIHVATWQEVVARFGITTRRQLRLAGIAPGWSARSPNLMPRSRPPSRKRHNRLPHTGPDRAAHTPRQSRRCTFCAGLRIRLRPLWRT